MTDTLCPVVELQYGTGYLKYISSSSSVLHKQILNATTFNTISRFICSRGSG